MAKFDPKVLKRPRWIAAIVVGIVIVIAFAQLGRWQLSRLDERRALNEVIAARATETPRPLAGLIGQYGSHPDALAHRQAIVEGRYITEDEMFSIGRTYDSLTGTMVITPLELDDGSVMIVVRGLAPLDVVGPPAEGLAPHSGSVTLTGWLDDGEEPVRIGEPEPDGGVLRSISRVDLAYIDEWSDADVLPISLILAQQSPESSGLQPIPIPRQELTEGRHLGYAIQWFAFALIVAIGVGALVWRAGTQTVSTEAGQATTSRR